jgi:hypothetical protein
MKINKINQFLIWWHTNCDFIYLFLDKSATSYRYIYREREIELSSLKILMNKISIWMVFIDIEILLSDLYLWLNLEFDSWKNDVFLMMMTKLKFDQRTGNLLKMQFWNPHFVINYAHISWTVTSIQLKWMHIHIHLMISKKKTKTKNME